MAETTQDTTHKKQNVATNTMIAMTMIGDGLRLLEDTSEDATGLTFAAENDPTLVGEELAHLTGYMVTYSLGDFLTDLKTWLAANATREDVFYQVRR
jgi:hypothetical protein